MKLKTNILFSLLLCGTFATAQNLKLDILPPSVCEDRSEADMAFGVHLGNIEGHFHGHCGRVLSSQTEPTRQNSLKSC